MPCMTKEGRCTREGVVYLMTCIMCKEDGRKVHYVGESARCGFDRGAEHWEALKKVDPESPLVEHNLEQHPEQHSTFSMEITEYISRNMTRQTTESVRIQMMGAGIELLNRRGEWGQNLPPKLSIQGEDEEDEEVKGPRPKNKRKKAAVETGTVTRRGDQDKGG